MAHSRQNNQLLNSKRWKDLRAETLRERPYCERCETKGRLTESDWIAHIRTKAYCDFGEFVCAYLKALEMAGVKTLTIDIYGFNYSCKYADGR